MKTYLVVLLVFLFWDSYSQKKAECTVYFNNNAIENGLCELNKSNVKITFTTGSSQTINVLDASNVQKVVFSESKVYVSDKNPDDDKDVFFELYVEGAVSLLTHDDYFFVQKEGQPIVKLENNVVEKTVNGASYEVSDNAYIGVLSAYMADCPDTQSIVAETILSYKSLIKIVSKYNSCVGSEFVDYKENQKFTSINLGPVLGVGYQQFFMKGNAEFENRQPYLYGIDPKSFYPLVGIEFEVFSGKSSGRTRFNFRLMFSKESFQAESERTAGVTYPRSFVTTFEHYRLRIPISGKFLLSKSKVQLYTRLGIGFSYLFNPNTTVAAHYVNQDGEIIMPPVLLTEEDILRKTILGAHFALGGEFSIKGRNFFSEIEFRTDKFSYDYTLKTDISTSSSYAIDFLIGYHF